ncbi:MAG TPA: type II secretion system protein GspG [Candidatus Acidoferrum sp.]|nr:type II secretion system protein GspG [Candidatus Acidoferrum sp.]
MEQQIMASMTKKNWNIAQPILAVLSAFAMVVLALFLILWSISYFESTATQQEMTTTAMVVDEERIFSYIREHRNLPQSLSELPQPDGKIDGTIDGWGRPITYKVEENDIVTLVSFGADGKPGGSGDAADIHLSFPTKDAKGNWIQTFQNVLLRHFNSNWTAGRHSGSLTQMGSTFMLRSWRWFAY